ncbi:hypothetical protein [Methanobacterium spitsbergense]|uniref:SIR2-like domain-containing protein n=1 Tax=Methanobacterium spitsbergense TaxID=2874285 RepID=A0A8T5UR80_9EURY|nr:hypothetical protein [Methanobacterium spitsbergense]MBZ2164476.1 hypothetical protein [Methanobacterium spitsbergense]
MFETATVLILGAGASMPYGYPSGEDLRSYIIKNLSNDESKLNEIIQLGYSLKDVKNFVNDLKGSQTYTIDEFIESREELIEIGKCAIAQALIPYESKNKLYEENNPQHWYRLLFKRMRTKKFEDFDSNEISIVTFNYDRSIEEFLFNTIQRLYGKSNDKCSEKINEIPIVHVYGKLGDLEWQNSMGRPYDPKITSMKLKSAAMGIRTMHDYDKMGIKKIKNFCKKCKELYFLGFGYDPINLRRLDILSDIKEFDGYDNDTINKTIRGTAFDLGEHNMREVSRYFNGKIEFGSNEEDCAKFLKKYGF